MEELRNKRGNSGSFKGYTEPTLVMSLSKEARPDFYLIAFSPVQLIAPGDAIMLGIEKGELYIWKEQPMPDSYYPKGKQQHMRFTSRSLGQYLVDRLKLQGKIHRWKLQTPRLQGGKYKLEYISQHPKTLYES